MIYITNGAYVKKIGQGAIGIVMFLSNPCANDRNCYFFHYGFLIAQGLRDHFGLGAAGVDNKGQLWYNQGNALSFDGIKVELAPGMPSDHIVAGEKSNLFFGTGLLADHNEVKVLDMADLDGSQNVRVIMRFTAGVQYGIGSDLALLTLA